MRNRTTEHKTGARLAPSPWLSEVVRRRALNALARFDAESVRRNRDVVRQITVLRSQYRRNLNALIGPAGVRRYRVLRSELADAPRAQKLRAARALLDSIGFNRERADRLRKQYLAATSKLLRLGDVRIPPGSIVVDDRCTPPVTYTPTTASLWTAPKAILMRLQSECGYGELLSGPRNYEGLLRSSTRGQAPSGFKCSIQPARRASLVVYRVRSDAECWKPACAT